MLQLPRNVGHVNKIFFIKSLFLNFILIYITNERDSLQLLRYGILQPTYSVPCAILDITFFTAQLSIFSRQASRALKCAEFPVPHSGIFSNMMHLHPVPGRAFFV